MKSNESSSDIFGNAAYYVYAIWAGFFSFLGFTLLVTASFMVSDIAFLLNTYVSGFLLMAWPFAIYGVERFLSNASAEIKRKYDKAACFHFSAISVFTLFAFIACIIRIVLAW